MMHENEYKSIIEVYKLLRKEGVIFPLRDPNNQFLINFNGKKSPIFETIESGNIYEEPNKQLARRAYKVEELNFTEDFDRPDYKNLDKPTFHTEIDYMDRYHQRQDISQPPVENFYIPAKEVNKSVNLSELDNLLELMNGVLTNPREFIRDDGKLIR